MTVVLSACAAVLAQAPTTFKTYPLTPGDTAAVEELLEALAGRDGNVVMDEARSRALVVATEENHARIADALGKVNAPPKNVRIEVRFIGRSSLRDSGASLGMEGGIEREEGMTRTRIHVTPRVRNVSLVRTDNTTQQILVGSGREASLGIGEDVPYLDWLVEYGMRGGVIVQRVNWQRVGSFMVVEPTVVGDGPMIRVRLTPELRGLVDGNPYHVRFSGLATDVVAQDGQSFQIGGLDRDAEFYSRFLVGYGRGGSEESLQIMLTPRIVGPSGL